MAILQFIGRYRFLSNFHLVNVKLDRIIYPSVEHAYQAAKTLDRFERKAILACIEPRDAKRLGGDKTKTHVQAGWNAMRVDVMHDLLRKKFAWPDLRELLLKTGDQ